MNPRMKNLIEVSVDSIRIHMPTAQHLVILKEKEADRYLPIWIGSFEAQAIAAKISGNSVGRPLTHEPYVVQAISYHDYALRVRGVEVTTTANVRALWAIVWFFLVACTSAHGDPGYCPDLPAGTDPMTLAAVLGTNSHRCSISGPLILSISERET